MALRTTLHGTHPFQSEHAQTTTPEDQQTAPLGPTMIPGSSLLSHLVLSLRLSLAIQEDGTHRLGGRWPWDLCTRPEPLLHGVLSLKHWISLRSLPQCPFEKRKHLTYSVTCYSSR